MKPLVHIGDSVASEYAFAGEKPGKLVKAFVRARTKVAKLLPEFFEFLVKLTEDVKGMVVRIGHGASSLDRSKT